jgi:hypothetical protein
MDPNIQKNGMLCIFGCIGIAGATIGIFSSIYGAKKTLKYVHKNIFDEHMAINIFINIGLISALLGIFFFTYATTVEEEIVKTNAVVAVSNIMDMISPLLNNDLRASMMKNIKTPDAKEEDLKAKKSNDVLMNDAYSKLLIILDIGLTIGFIISTIYHYNFIKILGLNLLIVTLVGCTEYTFLNFLPQNFISIDTNFIRYTILTTLKDKIYIDGKPCC